MKKIKSNIVLGVAISGLTLAAAGVAQASSHREAPEIADDPAADNTDVYAWVNQAHDKMYVVANWIPLEEPSGGPNFHKFSDDVRYEINLTRGPTAETQISYRITFETTPIGHVDAADLAAPVGGGKEFFSQLSGQSQTYTVTKLQRGVSPQVLISGAPVAPVNIGPRTDAVIRGGQAYDDAYAATFIRDLGTSAAEGRVWAGPRDDGFYVDLGGVFDLANLRGPGVAQDGVAGYNTHSIVLEIPTTKLTADGRAPGNTPSNATLIGVWASSSRKKVRVLRNTSDGETQSWGPWVQVSRLGLPLVNEALIGLQDKDKYNRTEPKNDVANFGAYFLNPVVVRDAEAVGIYAALSVDPTPFKSNRLDIINVINLKDIPSADAHSIPLSGTGDVLRVDIATNSGFPNGRPIPGGASPNMEQADVTDVLLSLILAGNPAAGIGDSVSYNDKPFLTTMPFLPLPHRGWDEGHGKPTP
jgi:hypothetical protein